MPSPVRGLLDPKNATDGGGPRFQEGLVRVDKSEFKAHQGRGMKDQPAPAPIAALVWTCTRLDDEHRPLTQDDGQPLVEELVFGLGSTSLQYVHPARANGPDDQDVEDATSEPGAVGPTITIVKSGWTLNKKSGFAVLAASLDKAGYFEPGKEMYEWAPAYEGGVFFLTNHAESIDRDGKKEQYFQKVVSQVVKRGGVGVGGGVGAGTGQKPAAATKSGPKSDVAMSAYKAVASATAPKPNGSATDIRQEAHDKLIELLPDLLASRIGSAMTVKSLGTMLGTKVAGKIKGQLAVEMSKLIKDAEWLENNGVMQIGEDMITPVFSEDRGSVTFQTA